MNKKLLVIAMAMPAVLLIGCGTNDTRVAPGEIAVSESLEINTDITQPVAINEEMLVLNQDQSAEITDVQPQITEPEQSPVNNYVDDIPEPETMQFYFASNEYELRNDDITELSQHAKYLVNNPKMKVNITGHADKSGSMEYNQKLAMKRADYVAKFLVQQGVMPEQINIYSQGESQTIAGIEHAVRDRRVELEYYNELQLSDKQVY